MNTGKAVPYRRARIFACGLATCLAGSSLFAAAAAADPGTDKQAQARVLAAQIDTLGRREAALSEQYDKSMLAVQAAQANIDQTTQRAARAEANAAQARSILRVDSIDAYMHGGGLAIRAGGAISADATILRAEYVKTMASTQSDHLDQFHAAAAQAKDAATALNAAKQQSARSAADLGSARTATVASDQQLQATLGQVKGDIATQVAQIEAAKQAAAAAQAQQALQVMARQQAVPLDPAPGPGAGARTPTAAPAAPLPGPVSPGGPSPVSSPPAPPVGSSGPTPVLSRPAPVGSGGPAPVLSRPAPPVGSGGSAAVAAAKSRLGLPYVWGAAGPDSFDCSGLTLWAWAHAGVSLPHFSGAQYASTAHIAIADLQPGDLVFESDPGAHVAMYIGGGQIIASPHTGTVVQIQPLSGNYVLASRP